MSRYLIKVTEQYRCDTEAEAEALINEAKEDGQYTVIKSSSEIKTQKAKGEVVDEWRRVLITKEFTSEKEPAEQVIVSYEEV
jgi:hypothetical protein